MGKTLTNFLSLGFLKFTDGLIVLFLIPIIISRVGIAHFGIIIFVQVFLNYGKIIVDYGFNITGVKDIILSREDTIKLSQNVSTIYYTRIFIGVTYITFLFIGVQLVPILHTHAIVFYLGFSLVLGHIFFPGWFFIGMQEAKFLAIINLLIKLSYALLVIFLVKKEADYVFIIAYQGIASLVIGILAIPFIKRSFNIVFSLPKWEDILKYLRNDFKLLLSFLSIEINASYSILILNILTTNTLSGYFSVMHKLVQPLRFLTGVFSQTIFPVVCEKTQEGWHSVKSYLKKSFSYFISLPILATFLLYLFAAPVFYFFTGESNPSLLANFKVYLLVPLIFLLSIPSYQILLAYERKSDYTKVYLSSLALNLVLAYLLTKAFELQGLIISIIIAELVITIGLFVMVRMNQKNIQRQV